jgi:hypothetical protein
LAPVNPALTENTPEYIEFQDFIAIEVELLEEVVIERAPGPDRRLT